MVATRRSKSNLHNLAFSNQFWQRNGTGTVTTVSNSGELLNQVYCGYNHGCGNRDFTFSFIKSIA
jgi:hypothetical protein